jgi:hypothetical protein
MIMRERKLEDLINPERISNIRKKQLEIIEARNGNRPVRRRPRDPIEAELLTRMMLNKIEKMQREGKLIRNGREWKIYTQ